jgi:transcriptional regulator with XRE-family HTH domain
MARAALGLSVRQLAARAIVGPNTVARFESGEQLLTRTVAAIQKVLEEMGVEFTNGEQPGAIEEGAVRASRDGANSTRSVRMFSTHTR